MFYRPAHSTTHSTTHTQPSMPPMFCVILAWPPPLKKAGDCVAFPANVPDGHHFINRSGAEARFLVVGSKAKREVATYSDVDLVLTVEAGQATYTYKDGSKWEGPR